MKKLSASCFLLTTTFTVKAQNMNFEETVKYINDKIECCTASNKFTISATRNGEIKWEYAYKYRINLFDLVPSRSSTSKLMENSGIDLWHYGNYNIQFQISKDTYETLAYFKAQADAERVFKALVHLRSLCKKEKDPFDN